MSMQPYPHNPIELKKQQVRKNAKSTAVCVVGGAGGGLVLSVLFSSFFLVIGLVIAVVGGVYYGSKVRKAIEKNPNSPY